jgi:hypothetical protein
MPMERKRAPQPRKTGRSKKVDPASAAATPATQAAQPDTDVPAEEIARLAYSFWEARGCQGGSPEDDWLRAEQELKAQRQAQGVLKEKKPLTFSHSSRGKLLSR